MTFTKSKAQEKVAIVGSGMAGLVTAHLLHHDAQQRYAVTVFESGESFSLDFASISIQDESQKVVDRIDVPMRAFADGYYKNLIRMYKYLGIRYHPQPFVYSFEKHAPRGKESNSEGHKEGYFVHSSNNHQMPPIRPRGISLFSWIIEVIYVAVCYAYWSLCCFWFPPTLVSKTRLCESLDEYMQRIMLPRHFVRFYLLPLLSSVATCSHKDLLQFPARDLTEYKRQSAGGQHYTVSGVHEVQRALGSGLEARFSATVTKVEVLRNERLEVEWNTTDNVTHKDIFDHVVLAVAPTVAGRVFQPLEKAMAQIPTTMVHSIVQSDCMKLADDVGARKFESIGFTSSTRAAETIRLLTSDSQAQTESIHIRNSGAMVTTCPLSDVSTQNVLTSVKFPRGLRTPCSRRVVNNIFGENPTDGRGEKQLWKDDKEWRNGDGSLWLVGGWCWDGMVLLEGCVVSAMRVASALGVDVPWRS